MLKKNGQEKILKNKNINKKGGKFPVGEMSWWGNVRSRSVRLGNSPVGELFIYRKHDLN